jgi:hypothetical protein
MAGTPRLIDQIRDLPNKEKYTTVTAKQGYVEKAFNGIEGMVTRKIRISGVKLVWDQYATGDSGMDGEEVSKRLFDYSGSSDIELLEMFADEVVIKSPLVFPQTNVWICARKLIFEGTGSINTTPLDYQTNAYTPERDASGRPVATSREIRAKDGAKGQPGGNITLCLPDRADITVSDFTTKRFIMVGGRGQDGEDGGYLNYTPKPDQRAIAGDASYLSLSLGPAHVTQLLNWPSDWRFPDNWEDDFRKYTVVYVKLDCYNDSVIAAIGGGKGQRGARHFEEEAGQRLWPGGVPDAFPSGKGGDGGDSGQLRSFLPWGSLVDGKTGKPAETWHWRQISEPSGGLPGSSKPMPPRRPQFTTDSSNPFVFMHMDLVRSTPGWESTRQPAQSTEKCPFNILEGKGQPGQQTGNRGSESKRHHPIISTEVTNFPVSPSEAERAELLKRYPLAWPNALVVEPVLRFARDAYLNGQRDEAKKILEVYRSVIDWVPATARTAALAGHATEITTLLSQIRDNLDFYGNPPGWLPRLSLLSNLQLFMADQINAVGLLYYAYKLGHTWDQVQNEAQLLKATRQALSQAVELAKQSFKEGLDLLNSSGKELADVQQQAKEIGNQIVRLNQTITEKAKDKAKEQAILQGLCGLASGLCKVIPVGQPYLGSAGDALFQPLGNIDLTNPSIASEAFTFAGGVGDGLQTFVASNKDALLSDNEASFAKQLARVKGSFEATEQEISTINQTIETEFDSKVKAYTDNLDTQIGSLQTEIATITDAAKKKPKQRKMLSFKEELALLRSRKLRKSIAELRKNKADAENAALTSEERAAKGTLVAQLTALDAKKTQLEQNSEKLTQKQADQQKFLGDALDHAGRIGAGIGNVANGLAKLVLPIDANSPEVAAIKAKIAETAEFKAEFESLMNATDDLTAKKQQLMEGVERAQHQLAECCATIAQSLVQSAALDRQIQSMGDALDLEVKAYARNLRQQSEERLRKSLYHVVKAYEYHQLRRMPPDVYNFDVIKKILELEQAKRAAAKEDVTLGEEEFKTIYNTVYRDKFNAIAADITQALQRVKPTKKNRYICELQPEHLEQLNRTWRFSFKLVDTFGKTSGNPQSIVGARIIGIAIKELEIATSDGNLSLDIEFTHSGEHVITDPAGYQYYFRIGKYPAEAEDGSQEKRWVDDQPISWRMTYNAGEGAVVLDENAGDEEILLHMLKGVQGRRCKQRYKARRAPPQLYLDNYVNDR